MKYVREYRDPVLVKSLVQQIENVATRPWTIMEICGGQTHSIMKFGLHALLPSSIRLIHGPGCPVCVTPISSIDHALFIAEQQNTIVCSYGDMLRVPGSKGSLLGAKSKGADVRIVLSPLDAVTIAKENPTKEVVLFAVGFETTAPANGLALDWAIRRNIKNFSLLVSHVLVPPAIEFLLQSKDNEINGFLAAGHVCTVTGYRHYHDIAKRHHTPIVVTGFEPVDILRGILGVITQLEVQEPSVSNEYERSVRQEGNFFAQEMMDKLFCVVDREWRGIGLIPKSGLGIRSEYSQYDAVCRFPKHEVQQQELPVCISGHILQGKKRPCECPNFGTTCTPEKPLGAPMVSSEGACAAYYCYHTTE